MPLRLKSEGSPNSYPTSSELGNPSSANKKSAATDRHWAKVPTVGLGISTVTEGASPRGKCDAAGRCCGASAEFRLGATPEREG